MKTIKLFFDFEFTSLSPDAQPISLGIISDEVEIYGLENTRPRVIYIEFSDFDINRCDDWVKENVIKKLKHKDLPISKKPIRYWVNCVEEFAEFKLDTISVIQILKKWLVRFKDYQIQFVCDCGTFDWYWMLQLIGKWDNLENTEGFSGNCPTCGTKGILNYKTGLPKLPENISPIPQDLNDLIAYKMNISIKEAFELDRLSFIATKTLKENGLNIDKHNAIIDARVIKDIYDRL